MTARTPSTKQKKKRMTGQNHQGWVGALPAIASAAEATTGKLRTTITSKKNQRQIGTLRVFNI
jgi:hypothetical protein